PIPDEDCEALSFYRPPENSPEMQHMRRRRQALGGFLPQRHTAALDQDLPDMPSYAGFALGEGGRNMSSTMAFVRMLAALMKSESLGECVVPIVADEARTFGMASLFRQFGIYAPAGQLYEPEDSGS